MSDYYKICGAFSWDSDNGDPHPVIQLDKTLLEIRDDIESADEPLIPLVMLTGTITFLGDTFSCVSTAVPESIYPFTVDGYELPSSILIDFNIESVNYVITEDGRLMPRQDYISEVYGE